MCARIARTDLLYDGCYAHVISRSIRKLKIFKTSDDFEVFKNELLVEKRKSQFRILHYCLMQTHFHLAVCIPDVSLFFQSMASIKSRYAYLFHQKYHVSGPIWRERYKSLLIENESYLLACGQYIEANPVKASLVKKKEDWPYSSYNFYQKSEPDELVDNGYDDVLTKLDMCLDELNEDNFEKGSLIGSAFFKFQFFENRKRG